MRRRWWLPVGAAVSMLACSSNPPTPERPGVGGSKDQAEAGAGSVASDHKGGGGGGKAGSATTEPAKGSGGSTGLGHIDVNRVVGDFVVRTKVDLIFMIDNSSSMADKQNILAAAVPALVDRLINPPCMSKDTGEIVAHGGDGKCPTGSAQDFQSPTDIHVGIIDSSLGGYGVPGICDDAQDTARGLTDPHNDDKAHLIVRGLSAAPAESFLNWSTGDDPISLGKTFASMVAGVKERGCGYEAQLESLYRFLIDPDPPASFAMGNDSAGRQMILASGTDNDLLQQRAAFLRPDSLVLAVLFSDEDDCSLRADGQAWLAFQAATTGSGNRALRPGTSACKANPNDDCCFNCGLPESQVKDGCTKPANDPACTNSDGTPTVQDAINDPANLRCWRQKQRYGMDFLYPTTRYVDGFSQPKILNRAGEEVTNPLFQCSGDDCTPRDQGSVLFAAVVGVPWQDLSLEASDIASGYMTPKELKDKSIWPIILGDPEASPPVPPSDPLMINSVEPRTTKDTGNRLGASAAPASPDSAAGTNPINGHEWNIAKAPVQENADLQYACIFDLPEPRDCSVKKSDCDCVDSSQAGADAGATRASIEAHNAPSAYKSPLCQDDKGYSTVQRRAKAYPGLRELQVVKKLGNQGLAASICPAHLDGDTKSPTYGYNPLIDLIIELTAPHLPPPAM